MNQDTHISVLASNLFISQERYFFLSLSCQWRGSRLICVRSLLIVGPRLALRISGSQSSRSVAPSRIIMIENDPLLVAWKYEGILQVCS